MAGIEILRSLLVRVKPDDFKLISAIGGVCRDLRGDAKFFYPLAYDPYKRYMSVKKGTGEWVPGFWTVYVIKTDAKKIWKLDDDDLSTLDFKETRNRWGGLVTLYRPEDVKKLSILKHGRDITQHPIVSAVKQKRLDFISELVAKIDEPKKAQVFAKNELVIEFIKNGKPGIRAMRELAAICFN